MKQLTWPQVNAWRVRQHHLADELTKAETSAAVSRVCGVQAQVLSAAELSIGARVDGIKPADVQKALWQDRTLVKTWAMRGTLHLLTVDDLKLYSSAYRQADWWTVRFIEAGLTDQEARSYFAAVPQVLSAEPMTREELAVAVAEHTGVGALREILITQSWGWPLKQSALRGELCFGPTRGRNITFVHPRQWFGEWQAIDPELAMQEIVRRYLRAYGPARPKDFNAWWGISGLAETRKLFVSLGDEVEQVDVAGWQGYMLRSSVQEIEEYAPASTVRLLPMFDAYTIGMARGDVEQVLPKLYKPLVFRQQGWITAVVLVDGRIRGVWEYKTGTRQTNVKVRMFESHEATPQLKEAIDAEMARLEAFWNTEVVLEYEAI